MESATTIIQHLRIPGILLGAILWIAACGGGSGGNGGGGNDDPPPPPEVQVDISPASALLHPGDTQAFTATVTNAANTAVTWSVNGLDGGDSTVGTVSDDGLYSAPDVVPAPDTASATKSMPRGAAPRFSTPRMGRSTSSSTWRRKTRRSSCRSMNPIRR